MHTEAESETAVSSPAVATLPVDKGEAPAHVASAPGPDAALQRKIDEKLAGAQAVIFYDGECGLCDRFIQFMLKRDKQRVFRFGAQQDDTFAQVHAVFPELGDLSTVVLAERLTLAPVGGGQDWRGGWSYTRYSTASLRAVGRLGGVWGLARALLLIPTPLRNWVYKLIAKNRIKLFGRPDACRLPTPEERALFLP